MSAVTVRSHAPASIRILPQRRPGSQPSPTTCGGTACAIRAPRADGFVKIIGVRSADEEKVVSHTPFGLDSSGLSVATGIVRCSARTRRGSLLLRRSVRAIFPWCVGPSAYHRC